jgi:hypothetical protein
MNVVVVVAAADAFACTLAIVTAVVCGERGGTVSDECPAIVSFEADVGGIAPSRCSGAASSSFGC